MTDSIGVNLHTGTSPFAPQARRSGSGARFGPAPWGRTATAGP
ncbi:MAG: hypothetical protein ACLQRH_15835 [Acidimicrobiales bacterium]